MDDSQWLEVLVRMVAGESAERPSEGLLDVRLRRDVDELTRFRVWKHGARWRVEHLTGRPRSIQGDRYTYTFDDEDGPRERPFRTERARGDLPHDEVSFVLRRREPTDWRSEDDYGRPAATPRHTTFLGRDAWEVRLSPPGHKVGDLVQVVDARDGRLLEESNTVLGDFARWEELREVQDLSDELFDWDGPYDALYAFSEDDVPEELREQHERDQQAEADFIASLELHRLSVSGTGEAFGHVDADGGHAMVHWSSRAGFHLQRQAVDAPDAEDDDLGERSERAVWTDDRWRWTLVTHGVDDSFHSSLVEELRARTRVLLDTPDP